MKEGLWPGCGGWFRVCFYSGGKGGQRPFRGLARLLEIDVPEGASFSGSPKRGVPGMCRMVEMPLPFPLHVGQPRGLRQGERGCGLGEDGEAGSAARIR